MKNTNWQEIELGVILSFQSRTGRKAGEGLEDGKYKFFTSSNVQSKKINEFDFDGEHLIFSSGGQAGVHYCNERFSASNDCFVVSIKDKVLTEYIYYYLKSKMHILERGFKGAGLKHISKSYIEKIKFIYPINIRVQQEIINLLKKSEKASINGKGVLELFDEYLKSVFYELLSKGSLNYSRWSKVKLKEVLAKPKGSIRTGPFGSDLLHSEFVSKGIAVLGIDNVVNNYFSWDERRYITKEKYEKLKRYTVHPKDVLVTIMGTVGRSVVVPENIPLAINTKHLVAITLNNDIADPFYISYLIYSDPGVLHQLNIRMRGAIMPGLNMSIIENLSFSLPPINIQRKFSSIIEHVERLKEKQKEKNKMLNQIFDSLMQKAFRGELIK
ncbi:MAG: restriction endonuclease subunit S [Nanoarchaeota archaeon]